MRRWLHCFSSFFLSSVTFGSENNLDLEAPALLSTQQLFGIFQRAAWILAFLLACYFWIRHIKSRRSIKALATSQLQILETKPLGNRQFLAVVQYEDKKILLGVGSGFIESLTELPDDLQKKARHFEKLTAHTQRVSEEVSFKRAPRASKQ